MSAIAFPTTPIAPAEDLAERAAYRLDDALRDLEVEIRQARTLDRALQLHARLETFIARAERLSLLALQETR